MDPFMIGKDIAEIVLINNSFEVNVAKKLDRLEDKYYLVMKDKNLGVYHRDYGLSFDFCVDNLD